MRVHLLGRPIRVFLIDLVIPCTFACRANATWYPDGTSVGVNQLLVAPDGEGGVFGVDATTYELSGRIFHLDSAGEPGTDWPGAGVQLVAGNSYVTHQSIQALVTLPDGEGGLFVLTFER